MNIDSFYKEYRKMRYHLGLGTNLGKRLYNLKKCLAELRGLGIIIKKTSSIYETQPVGLQNQPWFLNQVVEIETEFSPDDLLVEIKKVENSMGRSSAIRNAPRIIDIDILLADAMIVDSTELKIPHPRLLERKFALIPLVEISPEVVHPSARKSIKKLKNECPDRAVVKNFRLYRR